MRDMPKGLTSWGVGDILMFLRDHIHEDEFVPLHIMQQLVCMGGAPVWDYLRQHRDAREVIHPASSKWTPAWIPGYTGPGGYDGFEAPYSLANIYGRIEQAMCCARMVRGEDSSHTTLTKADKRPWKALLAPYRGQDLYVVERGQLAGAPSSFLTDFGAGTEPQVFQCGGMPVTCIHTRLHFSLQLFLGERSELMHPFKVKTFPLHRPEHELLIFAAPAPLVY